MHPYIDIWGVSIPSYGLFMVLAWTVVFCLSLHRSLKRNCDTNEYIVLFAAISAAVIFGGKLLYIMTVYISGDNRIHVETVSDNSGYVFYGGCIFGVITAIVLMRVMHLNVSSYCSSIIPIIPIGHSIGRIGCLLGGCCYGLRYDGLFAVTSVIAGKEYSLFPVQLLEVFANLLIAMILLLMDRKWKNGFTLLWTYILLYSFARFFLEYLRGDVVRGFIMGLSVSQWISVCGFVVALFALSMNCISMTRTRGGC